MKQAQGEKERKINQIKVGFSKETINRRRRSRGKLKLRMKINFNSFSLCLIENNASESFFFCWLPSAGVQSSRNTRKADETSWKLN